MKYKKIVFVIVICICIITTIIFLKINKTNISEKEDICAWIVDWDLERGIDEIYSYYKNLTSIQLFAAYFKEDGSLFLKNNLLESKLTNKNYKKIDDLYITIVNDVIKDDQTVIQKDNKIIREIILNEDKRKVHIKELIDLVCKYEFSGLELDYEKIDEDIWDEYAIFIDDLGKELIKKDKKLRIVLEPLIPIEKIDLPKDYEYVIMAYNLYGYHSGPGPKADKEFIKELTHKASKYLNNVRIAFSLGGFDWDDEYEKPKAITKTDAEVILEKYNSKIQRDEKSGAAYFEYKDENLKKHTVWYCDEETIQIWMDTAKENGIGKFALWRLGGNI